MNFEKAKNITPKTYMLNGLWLFFLTLTKIYQESNRSN